MKTKLSPLLAAFVAAQNAHDSAAFIACFSNDAVVHDEGHSHKGAPAIKAWFEEVSRKYRTLLEVTGIATHDAETILTGNISGNFEGSPFPLRYQMTISDGKITAVKIAP